MAQSSRGRFFVFTAGAPVAAGGCAGAVGLGSTAARAAAWDESFSYLSLAFALWPALDSASRVAVPAGVLLLLTSFAPDFLAVAKTRG